MRAFVHTVGGEPFNEECASAWRGFNQLGVEVVPFSNNEQLEQAERSDIIVGGMLVCEHALKRFGVEPPTIDYPESLSESLGRVVRKVAVGSIKKENLPLFVKPVLEKDLPGIVVSSEDELKPYLAKGDSYSVYTSKPISLVSEWRCFVRHGELIGASCYRGDGAVEPNWLAVDRMVRNFTLDLDDWRIWFTPAGYSLDVGVTRSGATPLIEVNDGYALGSYGLDDVSYALLLTARWSQLMSQVDPLRRIKTPKVTGPLGKAMRNQGWHDRFYRKPGLSIPASEPDLPKWAWGVAANVREYPRNMTEEQAKRRRRGTKHFAAGTLVWVLELWNWDESERVAVVGRKKGTHRYIRKVMPLDELENFRAKKVFSPTVISWMRGVREKIPNHGSGKYSSGRGEGSFYTIWSQQFAEGFAEYENKKDAGD